MLQCRIRLCKSPTTGNRQFGMGEPYQSSSSAELAMNCGWIFDHSIGPLVSALHLLRWEARSTFPHRIAQRSRTNPSHISSGDNPMIRLITEEGKDDLLSRGF